MFRLFTLEMFESRDIYKAYDQANTKWLDVYKNGLKVWPAVMYFNIKYIPEDYVILAFNTVGFFWNLYFSWYAHSEFADNQEHEKTANNK